VLIDNNQIKRKEKSQKISLSKGKHKITIRDNETGQVKQIDKFINSKDQVIKIGKPNFPKQKTHSVSGDSTDLFN
jgi:predicted metal-dependent hydrolase